MLYCFSDGGFTFSQMDPGIASIGHLQLTDLTIYLFIYFFSTFSKKDLAPKIHWLAQNLDFKFSPIWHIW